MTNDEKLMQQALTCIVASTEYKLGNPAYEHAEATIHARLAQPEPEPVAWLDEEGWSWIGGELPDDHQGKCKPLYSAPPQREFVGLTDEEVRHIYGKDMEYQDGDYARYARAIEAKLKEKNT